MNESATDLDLITGYLAHYAGDDSYVWAYDSICDLLSEDPERLWRITLQMIAQTNDEATLSYIAVGPLEDLLAYHGDQFISRIEMLSKDDRHFRKPLRGVWGHVRFTPETYARVRAATKN